MTPPRRPAPRRPGQAPKRPAPSEGDQDSSLLPSFGELASLLAPIGGAGVGLWLGLRFGGIWAGLMGGLIGSYVGMLLARRGAPNILP